MQVDEFLERSAARMPEKIALICQREQVSYAEINRRSSQFAHSLRKHGVQRGDRVAIYLDNSIEAVVSIFGVLKAGAIFLMINPTTKADKLAFILNDCRAVALMTHFKQMEIVSKALSEVPSLRFLIVAGTDPVEEKDQPVKTLNFQTVLIQSMPDAERPLAKCAIDIDLATIIYTSGSTGFPKGVMMTHLNMVTAATSITQYLANSSNDIILSALPLAFDYGLYQILMAFKVGATVVLETSFAYPHMILDKLAKEKVTGFPLVPTMAAILLQLKGLTPGRFPHLRYITNTAAALPPAHIAKLRALFPETTIYSMYGLTECKRVSYLPPSQLDLRPTSVGIAIPNTEVYVVDEEGKRVGPGIIGELVVRGAHVMKGYWERKEETDRVLRPGLLPGEKVLYTGDLFKMDADGFLYFVGRKDDIIKTRGEKVSPKEIEAVLYSMPEVAEAAIVGVPDEILGHAIKAVIVPGAGSTLTEQDILRYCKQHLEEYMIPKSIEFREALPKTGTGKIQKRDLVSVQKR